MKQTTTKLDALRDAWEDAEAACKDAMDVASPAGLAALMLRRQQALEAYWTERERVQAGMEGSGAQSREEIIQETVDDLVGLPDGYLNEVLRRVARERPYNARVSLQSVETLQ